MENDELNEGAGSRSSRKRAPKRRDESVLNGKPGQGNVVCPECVREGVPAGDCTFETAQDFETHRSEEHRRRPA